MRVVALISGGKDSCYNMMQCVQQGHVIVGLANLKPKQGDELDSYMYQTVGHHAVDLYAQAMDLPLYQRVIQGSSVEQGQVYSVHKDDEVEDLYELLKQIKGDISFDAVSVGAILSDYQRVRVEHVCSRLGLSSLAYLWRRDQKQLLDEMISSGIQAILIKVAAMGLYPNKHLGMPISGVVPIMCNLNKNYGSNICGEGGEYETFTLDCPLFKKKIVIDESEVVIHSDDAFAPVGFLHFKKMHLQDKEKNSSGFPAAHVCKQLSEQREKLVAILFTKPDSCTTMDLKKSEKHTKKVIIPSTFQKNSKDCIRHFTSGDYVWVSGIFGRSNKRANTLSVEDITKDVMQRLSDALTELNASLDNAVMVHLFVKNMDDFARVNSVYKRFFTVNPPARACVELDLPEDIILQVDCLAYRLQKEKKDICPSREAMHVQSISHWAPANIGPYSQAIKVGDTMFVSGSIGLCPTTMTLTRGGMGEEATLSLQHVDRIIAAFAPGESIQSIVQGFCYINSTAHVSVAKDAWLKASKAKIPDSTEDQNDLALNLLFIVIPALPKKAAVEWHVVVQDSQMQRYYDSRSLSREGFNVGVRCVATSGRTNHALAFNCVIESNSTTCDLEQIMESFFTELQYCSSQHNSDISHLLYIRIFYTKKIMGHSNSWNFIQTFLERKCNPVPVVSLVPADALESDQVIMVFSCLLQKPHENSQE